MSVKSLFAAGVAAAMTIPLLLATPAFADDVSASSAQLAALSSPITVSAIEVGETGDTYAFVRGTDNFLYYLDVASKKWTKTAVAGGLTSSPSALRWASPTQSGNIKLIYLVVANGPGNHPRVTTSRDLRTWTAWQPYNDLLAASATSYAGDNTRTALFFRGTDGALYGQGHEVVRIGGVLTSPPVSSNEFDDGGQLSVTVRGTDGCLYRSVGHVINYNPKMSAFERLSTAQVASAASLALDSDRYYFRAPNNALQFYSLSKKGIGTVASGQITSTPAAVRKPSHHGPESVWVLARGTDGALYGYDGDTNKWTGFGGQVA